MRVCVVHCIWRHWIIIDAQCKHEDLFSLPGAFESLNFVISVLQRDRIRTTNNMLGDCYAAAIVEHLSKEQLLAAGAAVHQVRTKLNLCTVNQSLISTYLIYIFISTVLRSLTNKNWSKVVSIPFSFMGSTDKAALCFNASDLYCVRPQRKCSLGHWLPWLIFLLRCSLVCLGELCGNTSN